MRILLQALFVWLASTALATAGWEVRSSERVNPPNELVEHRVSRVEDNQTGANATLHFAQFSTSAATLRVIDQPAAPRLDLASAMKQAHALAGVNGGYFDPSDAPVGLLVSDGRKVAQFGHSHLLSGVLWATPSKINLMRASHFKMSDQVRDAVQCGPLLVERSRAVAGLNATRSARRTFAAVDGDGQVALGVCSAVSLAELGQILAIPNALGTLKTARALNLDGGSSSAFWFAGEIGAISLPELKTVRDFIALVPKKNR